VERLDTVMVFCPTWRLEPETLWAIFALEFDCPRDYVFTHDNLSVRDVDNVNWNYRRGRQMFLAGDYTHLMTVESDIIPPPDAWKELRALGVDVALGSYRFREKHSGFSACNLMGHSGDGPGPVTGVGLGCMVARRAVLEQISFQAHEKLPCDTPFAEDVLEAGFTMWGHPGVACGHKDEDGAIVWPHVEPAWFGEMRGFVPPEYDQQIRYFFRRGQTMRIKAVTGFSGPGGSFAPQGEYDVPKESGREWVSSGLAVEIRPEKEAGDGEEG